MLKSIRHPNITAFYDSWQDAGAKPGCMQTIFVTELMTSGTLKECDLSLLHSSTIG